MEMLFLLKLSKKLLILGNQKRQKHAFNSTQGTPKP